MEKQQKEKILVCRISSSIENFREKILDRFELPEWSWTSINQRVIFFGMYHIGDYIRLLIHRGPKTVFWCGSDILNLQNSKIWSKIITKIKTAHLCENDIERLTLVNYNILATILPMCFDDIKINTHYRHSKTPHVYLCIQPGYEKEYGLNIILKIAPILSEITFHIYGSMTKGVNENIIYHGKVSNEQFTEEIKQYQAGLRLNKFDGFSEVLAKSALMGQYPISMIKYPFIIYSENDEDLIVALKNLRFNKKPNLTSREYWLKKLSIKYI